jgi:secreted trypsin-like serine protease
MKTILLHGSVVAGLLALTFNVAGAEAAKAFASHAELLNKSLEEQRLVTKDLKPVMQEVGKMVEPTEVISQFIQEWQKADKSGDSRLPVGFSKFEALVRSPDLLSDKSIYRDPVYQTNVADVIKDGTSGRIFSPESVVAKKKDHPDCVAVGRSGQYVASGVIIDNDFVLTAAHICEDDPESVPDLIWLGQVTSNSKEAPKKGQALRIVRYYRHENYKFGKSYKDPVGNDLMLLEIDPADRGAIETRTPIAKDEDLQGFGTKPLNSVRAAGFGHSRIGFQDKLEGFGVRRYITLYLAARDVDVYGLHQVDTPAGKVVAEMVTNPKRETTNIADTCKGDSGGPVYIAKGGDFFLVGITSRATPAATQVCGDGSISVYLPAYRDWLQKAFENRAAWKAVE